MQRCGRWGVVSIVFLLVFSAAAVAGDFDWTRDFNLRAQADPSGFRARLAARFKIGDAQIEAVLGNVGSPADAYLIFSLGELSGRPAGYVLERYRVEKGQGWGALAQSLGIKPGSKEFHALKSGNTFYAEDVQAKGKSKAKSKGKGKAKD